MKCSEIKYEKKYIDIRISEGEAKSILCDLKAYQIFLEGEQFEEPTEWLKKYLEKLIEND